MKSSFEAACSDHRPGQVHGRTASFSVKKASPIWESNQAGLDKSGTWPKHVMHLCGLRERRCILCIDTSGNGAGHVLHAQGALHFSLAFL